MKTKILFLLLASFFISTASLSQNNWLITKGIIHYYPSGTPFTGVPNHEVLIQLDGPAGTFYENSVFTDLDGHYYDSIPYVGIIDGQAQISTIDPCSGTMYSRTSDFTGLHPSLNLYIPVCEDSGTRWMSVGGFIYDGQIGIGIGDGLEVFIDLTFSNGDVHQETVLTNINSFYQSFDTIFFPPNVYGGTVEVSTTDPCTGLLISENQNFTGPFPTHVSQDFLVCEQLPQQECENFFTYSSNGQNSFDFEGFFPDTSLMFPYYWSWDFGDGTTGFGQNISHTFPAGDTASFTVCLTTFSFLSNDSCYYTSCQDVIMQAGNHCIGGYVYVDSGIVVDEAFVHLMMYDTLWNNLLPIETVEVDESGHYLFDNVNQGVSYTYFTQAILSPQSVYFGQFVPTYHYNAMIWSNAQEAYPELCPGILSYDIMMQIYDPPAAGPGSVNGTINSSITRDAMANIEMMLYDDNMNAIGYVYTNESGFYSFSNIAFETYYISVERVGVAHSTFMVVLDENNPTAIMNIIIENGSALLSVGENDLISIIGDLYPNPTKNSMSLSINAKYAIDAVTSVHNQLGQEIIHIANRLNKGTNNISIDVSQLPESIYYLRLQVDNNKPLMRKFIKID